MNLASATPRELSLEVPRACPPATPAAPATQALGDASARVRIGVDLALELEGRRRAATLNSSLFWIPATAIGVLALAAGLGVRGIWLVFCALAGLATGPAITTASIALLSLVGMPAVRVQFAQRARALGLARDEIELAWHLANEQLDADAKARLGRQPGDPTAHSTALPNQDDR